MEARIAQEMTEHLQAIAAEHNLSLVWTRKGWKHAEAYIDTRGDGFPAKGGLAVIPVIRTAADYLTGLHELGHLLDENSLRFLYARDQYEEILTESAAWAWAAEQLLPQFRRHIRAKDWNRVAYGWRTYVAGGAWARKRPQLCPKTPRAAA